MRLFRPAWDSGNVKRATRAIDKITDPAKLARIAKTARSESARKTAVEKITDQSVLADVAKNDEDWHVREDVVKRLTDQYEFADIAKTATDKDIRRKAVDRLTDRDVLTEIANGAAAEYFYEWEETDTRQIDLCNRCTDPQRGWDCAFWCGKGGTTTESYTHTYTLDLRDVARQRLDELNKTDG